MTKSTDAFYKKKKEWSKIKDKLLEAYLLPYFQKLLKSNKPICYVDCFAGRGNFDDGNNGSPLIALNIREKALARAKKHDNKGIEMFFIETKYAKELTQNIPKYYNDDKSIKIINGKFEEKIEDLLKEKKGYNVFLYIDPYGIRSLDFSIFKQFKNYGFNTFEMLINFNSFGFLRAACGAMEVEIGQDVAFQNLEEFDDDDLLTKHHSTNNLERLLNNVADGEYWKNIVMEYKDKHKGYQAEQCFSTEYKQHLRQHYNYVLDMAIRLKEGQPPKYRMVHVCNHADGCFLMAHNMLSRKNELVLKIQNKGQLVLFQDNYSVEGVSITEEEIKEMIRFSIKTIPNKGIGITNFLANFVTEYGIICNFTTIYHILEKMRSAGVLNISRIPQYTKTGKASTFWTEDKGKKVILEKTRDEGSKGIYSA